MNIDLDSLKQVANKKLKSYSAFQTNRKKWAYHNKANKAQRNNRQLKKNLKINN